MNESIEFEESWFHKSHKRRGVPTKELWERHLLPVKDEIDSYLEIGTAEGHSARWVLEVLKPSFAVCVDPYIPPRRAQAAAFEKYKDNAHLNLKEWIDDGQLELCCKTSLQWFAEELGKPLQRKFSLVYVDGDHRGIETMTDMLLAFQLLTTTGRIVVDDLQRAMHNGRVLTYWAAAFFRLLGKDRLVVEWEEGRQICFRRLKTRQEQKLGY